jgi:hypothetical protein
LPLQTVCLSLRRGCLEKWRQHVEDGVFRVVIVIGALVIITFSGYMVPETSIWPAGRLYLRDVVAAYSHLSWYCRVLSFVVRGIDVVWCRRRMCGCRLCSILGLVFKDETAFDHAVGQRDGILFSHEICAPKDVQNPGNPLLRRAEPQFGSRWTRLQVAIISTKESACLRDDFPRQGSETPYLEILGQKVGTCSRGFLLIDLQAKQCNDSSHALERRYRWAAGVDNSLLREELVPTGSQPQAGYAQRRQKRLDNWH